MRRSWIGCLVGLMMMAAPAQADLITIEFEGEIDLTSDGGAVYGYSGFFTWNTAEPVENTDEGIFTYALHDFELIFGGNDVTVPPSPMTIGNGLSVVDNLDPLGTGVTDALAFYGHVGRPYDPTGDLHLIAILAGPTSMFGSPALPQNLDFLSDVTDEFVRMSFEPDDDAIAIAAEPRVIEARGTFEITATRIEEVPEPATLTLAALGLAGAFARFRRRA